MYPAPYCARAAQSHHCRHCAGPASIVFGFICSDVRLYHSPTVGRLVGRLKFYTSLSLLNDFYYRAAWTIKNVLAATEASHVQKDTAILVEHTPGASASGDHECSDQTSTPNAPAKHRHIVAECQVLWQRNKEEHLLFQHTYTPEIRPAVLSPGCRLNPRYYHPASTQKTTYGPKPFL